jgi:hypothetical protein
MSDEFFTKGLRERIQSVYDGDDRLWQRDYFGRRWLAIFAADATYLADYVEKRLDNRSYPERMPTTTSSAARSTIHQEHEEETHIGGTHTVDQTIKVDEVALDLALDNSQSSVIYVDIPGCDDAKAKAMLLGEPPLHVERDLVREKWAVRKATDEEVADAKAAAEAEHPKASAAAEA